MTTIERSLSAVFHMYDVNNDGYLTRDDLNAYADRLCEQLDVDRLSGRRHALQNAYDELWGQLSVLADIDRDGHIGEQEYLAAMAHSAVRGDLHFRASTLQAIDALAEVLDSDGNGYLDVDEYRQIFGGVSGSDDAARFATLDVDGDGRLSLAEFRAGAAAFFPLASADWFEEHAEEASRTKGIALVAHDARKPELLAWAKMHAATLAAHRLFGTGTTSRLLADSLDLPVSPMRSGPLGGDQQIGARIAEGEIDLLIFFWDPMAAQPHDADVKALVRLAVLANVPAAFNRATADLLITAIEHETTSGTWVE